MVQSKLLLQFKEINHYFSQKHDKEAYHQAEFVHQVHSSKVIYIDKITENLSNIDADGMVAKGKRAIGVKTADCLPILLYDPKKKVIGAIHAGWKGLAGGIIENAIRVMKEADSLPCHIFVTIGPHIRSCCYNVTPDRIKIFADLEIDQTFYVKRSGLNLYLDLGKFASVKLTRLGIPPAQIETSELCTACNEKFYSFRREGKSCGRMISLIGLSQ